MVYMVLLVQMQWLEAHVDKVMLKGLRLHIRKIQQLIPM